MQACCKCKARCIRISLCLYEFDVKGQTSHPCEVDEKQHKAYKTKWANTSKEYFYMYLCVCVCVFILASNASKSSQPRKDCSVQQKTSALVVVVVFVCPLHWPNSRKCSGNSAPATINPFALLFCCFLLGREKPTSPQTAAPLKGVCSERIRTHKQKHKYTYI